MDTHTHYSALDCDENASKEELKKQFKKLALKKHPDKSDSSSCCEEFHRIDSAIKVLSNDSSRRQYDSQLIENRNESRIINDDISLSDLTLDSETKTFWYGCRCGGSYSIEDNDLKTNGLSQYSILNCDSCSLSVRLKPN